VISISVETKELEELLFAFVWDFKIGDNILYNAELLQSLIHDHNKGAVSYSKPIAIIGVSIIEAILVDFVERLDQGTDHFPDLLIDNKNLIKRRLAKEKKSSPEKGVRLRNFGYSELISLCEELELLGPARGKINVYSKLKSMGRFRNRVHIRNYFNNFGRDESRTFSERRAQMIVDYVIKMFRYFEQNYYRWIK